MATKKPTLLPVEEETHPDCNWLENLPSDILITNILSRLPLTSLLNFKATSRFGRDLAADPSLVLLNPCLIITDNNHFNFTSLYFVDTDGSTQRRFSKIAKEDVFSPSVLVRCCNGLLCIYNYKYERYRPECLINGTLSIFNPFARDSDGPIKIPVPDLEFDGHQHEDILGRFLKVEWQWIDVVFGFGLHPRSGAFKVIRIVFFFEKFTLDGNQRTFGESKVDVLTIKTKEWRKMGSWPYELNVPKESGALVEGSFHWVVRNHGIVSFELEEEVFSEIPLPTEVGLDYVDSYYVSVLNGCLSVVVRSRQEGLTGIWVMDEYKVKESWVKRFSIDDYLSYDRFYCGMRTTAICELNNGELLLGLVSYDPKSRKFKSRGISQISKFSEVLVFWPTLVSAKETIGGKLS